ncbi:TIGR01244 family sulfur transferase [Marinomonas algarum]|uniref:TIGR01244 family phosphatase n=1 Tax=Marinomonas algarum TaxID=2883105 RepID=A0A9X1IJ75_9GAMM|nr:TIGR01244 family sulfur transferase [Marinomonas algarum]MCB5160509.1 TIGR01244 family phosphatase [Marinomonas algarum]
MNTLAELDAYYFATPQLVAEDLASLKEQGFERVINNRPEGEADDQPVGDELRAAAEALGLEYIANPIDLPKLSQVQIDQQGNAIAEQKKTVAFCRTGTRSTVLWVLLENAKGGNIDTLSAYAAAKGFDLTRCEPAMAPWLK